MSKPFDKVHVLYDMFMKFWRLYKEDVILDMLGLQGDEIIVDIGGGTGYVAEYLSRYCGKVFVIDESKKMLSHVATRNNIETIHGDALDTPFEDKSVDIAVLTDVMHHIENQDGLIKEMYRILTPSGRILIYDFNKSNVITKMLSIMETVLFGTLYYRELYFFIALLESYNFRIEELLDKGFYFILSGRKQCSKN